MTYRSYIDIMGIFVLLHLLWITFGIDRTERKSQWVSVRASEGKRALANPSKVAEVPALLEQFKGRERELFEAVQAKYGQGVPTGTSAYAAQQVEERRSVAAHPAAVLRPKD